MITFKNTILINNNMAFLLRSLLLRPFYISCNTCIYRHIDSGNGVFSLFLDFRKAFDCVNHEILLSKLNTYGIRGKFVHLFRLSNKQRTIRMYKQCKLKPQNHSVQWSAKIYFGPSLFLILINITKCSNQFKYILYADDSTLSTCR